MKGQRLKISFHTGPCIVKEVADRIRNTTIAFDVIEGTETVYFKAIDTDDWGSIGIMANLAEMTGLEFLRRVPCVTRTES